MKVEQARCAQTTRAARRHLAEALSESEYALDIAVDRLLADVLALCRLESVRTESIHEHCDMDCGCCHVEIAMPELTPSLRLVGSAALNQR